MRLGSGPGEEKLGPRIRNQVPRGRSRCRLRARPLGLKGLPELKTICTAPFLIWLCEQPTLRTDCLSLSPCLTDQRSTKRGKHTQSKIKIGTPLARQNKLEQTNYRESTHKQWSICGSLDYQSRWLPPTPPPESTYSTSSQQSVCESRTLTQIPFIITGHVLFFCCCLLHMLKQLWMV